MQGFCDQIARQYDTLVTQTQIESTASSENFVTPSSTDLTNADNWLELGEINDEPIVPISKESEQPVVPGMTISKFRYSIQIDSFLDESVCTATEENNKKNATSEVSEQRILIESDTKLNLPNISSLNILTAAAQSSPTTINLANIPIIDDETNVSEQQQQQAPKQVDDETTSDEDDDEQTQLKRLKANNEQIEAPVEEDEDEDEEQPDEVRRSSICRNRFERVSFLGRRRI